MFRSSEWGRNAACGYGLEGQGRDGSGRGASGKGEGKGARARPVPPFAGGEGFWT
jgi:hypothetical protein